MNLIPNPTLIALQAIPFLLTLVALHMIIFKPMLAYLDSRDDSISGTKKKAEALEADAEQKMADLQKKLAAARSQAGEIRAAARAEALAEYNQTVQTARSEAEKRIEAAVTELDREKDVARITLRSTAKEVANQIASHALGRELA
jgi:F-type H+-transporting ATPase subunit b